MSADDDGKLILGGEVRTAIMASAEAFLVHGYDGAVAALGFDPDGLRTVSREQARDWLRRLPINGTLVELEAAIGSAESEGVIAGIRLGRMYAPGADAQEFLRTALRMLYDSGDAIVDSPWWSGAKKVAELGEPCATCGYRNACSQRGEDCHS